MSTIPLFLRQRVEHSLEQLTDTQPIEMPEVLRAEPAGGGVSRSGGGGAPLQPLPGRADSKQQVNIRATQVQRS
jgi:hypothetical protein